MNTSTSASTPTSFSASSSADITLDVIDQAVPLAPGDPLHDLRRERLKVVDATQGSYDAMFSANVQGVTVVERLAVALHACQLSAAHRLAAHYRQRLIDEGAEPDRLLRAPDARLATILDFAGKLILRPLDGDKSSVEALLAAGLGTPAIVALGQLIAFLSYQVRLVAGLQAMAAADDAAIGAAR